MPQSAVPVMSKIGRPVILVATGCRSAKNLLCRELQLLLKSIHSIELKSMNGHGMPKAKRHISVTAVARQADPEAICATVFVPQGSATASPNAVETERSRHGTQPSAVQSLPVP